MTPTPAKQQKNGAVAQTRIEPFKYIVQPVALEKTPDGKILREVTAQAVTFYDPDDVKAWLDAFPGMLATAEVQQAP